MSAWLGWMDLSQNITPPRAPCGAKKAGTEQPFRYVDSEKFQFMQRAVFANI